MEPTLGAGQSAFRNDVARRPLPCFVSWHYDFTHPVSEIWPYVADTDRINRAAGLTAVDYRHEADSEGGSIRIGAYRGGLFGLVWREHPYEWIKERYFQVEREYDSGPLRRLILRFETRGTARGSRVEVTFEYDPRNAVYRWFLRRNFAGKMRKDFEKAYRQIEEFLSQKRTEPFRPRPGDDANPGRKAIQRMVQKLEMSGVSAPVAARMIHLVYRGQPPDLVRIRPFALARAWNLDRLDVLNGFLRATRSGIFSLSWDLLCPSCRGAKARPKSLAELKGEAHCDACNVSFGVDFDRSVELSFTVNPAIRPVQEVEFCVGGPQRTPHYLLQLRFPPETARTLVVNLPEGVYIGRSPHSPTRFILEVSGEDLAAGRNSVAMLFDRGHVGPDVEPREARVRVIPGAVRLEIGNALEREMLFIFERARWLEDACTAAYVTSLQEFRDMFSSEVLRPGQEISVRSVALLFTDLKGSTSLYSRVGDASAFSMVQDHFEILTDCVKRNEGGLVKTIGDAVMAAFVRPERALQAALDIHREIAEANAAEGFKEPLRLKIGIHHGSCFAVNLNDRMDYFGTTVNIAARTEGQCEGGDIVITQSMVDEPAVLELVQGCGFRVTQFTRPLKGFDEAFKLYRIDCAKPASASANARGPSGGLKGRAGSETIDPI